MNADSLILGARRRLGVLSRRLARRGSAPVELRAPEVVPERTHYGPLVDRIVERLRRNQRRYGVNADYDVVRERFDHYHAILQAPKLATEPTVDPIRVFLRRGVDVRFDPEIHFSMKKYLERHPEHAETEERSPYLEWLRRGQDAGEIADPADGVEALAGILGRDKHDIVAEAVRLRDDMTRRLRSGTLGEMFAKAVELEPLIGEAWAETTHVKQLPLRNESVVRGAAAIWQAHGQAGLRRARVVIVSDRPEGGGEGFDGVLARALAPVVTAEEIVVIYTDAAGVTPAGRLPAGVRTVDLASGLRDVLQGVREQSLISLVRSFGAEVVINVESQLFYAALAPYGRALAQSDRVFLCFFGADHGPLGAWEGWGLRWLYSAFDYVSGFIVDSESVRDQLVEHFCLSPEDAARVQVLRPDVRPEIAVLPRPAGQSRRPVVAWQASAGRRQGQLVALELAARMPDVDFRLYLLELGDLRGDLPANVTASESAVDVYAGALAGVDAWLHTSPRVATDHLLLDVAMTQTPIVAPETTTRELLSPTDAWLVSDINEAKDYESALRSALTDPEASAERARRLRARLVEGDRAPDSRAAERLLNPSDATDPSQPEQEGVR